MRRPVLVLISFCFLLAGCGKGGVVNPTKGEVTPTDRPCADLQTGAQMFGKWVEDPASVPLSFVYGGEAVSGLQGFELLSKSCESTASGKSLEAVFRIDDNLTATLDAFLNNEFGELEYTLWFENKGKAPSKTISEVNSAVIDFKGNDPVLRGCLGDHQNRYADYQTPLRDTTVS